MNIIFNKTSKPNAIFSVWVVLIGDLVTEYKIIGAKHGNMNVYSIYNNKKEKSTLIGSLEKAKQILRTKLIKGV
jgi:hypothetical protein